MRPRNRLPAEQLVNDRFRIRQVPIVGPAARLEAYVTELIEERKRTLYCSPVLTETAIVSIRPEMVDPALFIEMKISPAV